MEEIILKPIGKVIFGRQSMDDDYWGNAVSVLEMILVSSLMEC
jgi:hypothetical protein